MAHVRAEARQGLTLERSFGGEDACHRNDDDPLFADACQPVIAVELQFRMLTGCGGVTRTRVLMVMSPPSLRVMPT